MAKEKVIFPLLLLLLYVVSSKTALSQTTAKSEISVLHAKKISDDFDITGKLSHPAWQRADVANIRYEIAPDDEDPAPVKTEVRILYSDDNLYISFKAYDPNPSKIRASITERDRAFGQDYVGILLDTFGNRQQAYEFFVNPLGIQIDGFRSSNGEDMSFNALWYSAGRLTDFGYVAVMKIPFKSLNFPDKQVQDWSLQLFRNYPRDVRYQLAWTDVNHSDACLLCQNGELANIRGIEAVNTVEFLPYIAGFQSSSLKNRDDLDSGLDSDPINVRIGGSISYEPNSTMSLNAVINPDFSQVESDAAQIAVNEPFALFYPEKRPFFLESAALFETDIGLFYSRTINNPLAAGKFTQKAGNYSIAFLTAYDENTPFIIPGLDQSSVISSGLNSYSNILRGKYSFGPETFVGGLITTRNQPGGANYVGSIDWQVRLGDNYYTTGQLAYSYTDELNDSTLFDNPRNFGRTSYDAAFNGEQYGGWAMILEFGRDAKYYSFEFGYEPFSPTFQSQNGFINQTNRHNFSLNQNLSYYPNTSWLAQGSIFSFASLEYDFLGQLQERFILVELNNTLVGQTHLSVSYLPLNDERFRGKYFKGMHRWSIGVSTNPLELILIEGKINYGRFVYRTQNPAEGKGYNISMRFTLKPTNSLQLDFNYDYSTLSSLDGSQTFYSGNIMRLTGRFHFSRKLFIRLITQYNSFNNQIQIYPLLHYQLNPFTRFYIGMTDYLQQPGFADGLKQYHQVNRQFFVKFQYLFRL